MKRSMMARKDVILDSLAPSLSYHTMEQVKASLQSLVSHYPHSDQMYDRLDMECIKITGNLTTSTTKPVIRVVGWWGWRSSWPLTST
jgi:hypothetical protein